MFRNETKRSDNKRNDKLKPEPSDKSPEMSTKWKDDILTLIYEVHQQIGSHDKSSKRESEVKSALKNLKTDIQQLTNSLCDHEKGEELSTDGKEEKQKNKTKSGQNNSASGTVDLSTAINNAISKNRNLKSLLLTYRRDFKTIAGQVLSLGNEQGIHVEQEPKDASDVHKMLEMIQNKNKELSDHLDSLDKAIKAARKERQDDDKERLPKKSIRKKSQSNSRQGTQQTPAIANKSRDVKTSDKEEHKSLSKSSIVLEAITTIKKLQAYSSEMDCLAYKTIGLTIEITDPNNEPLPSALEKANDKIKEDLNRYKELLDKVKDMDNQIEGLKYNLLQVINLRQQNMSENGSMSTQVETGKNPMGSTERSVDNRANTDKIYREKDFQSSITWLQQVYSQMKKMKDEIEEYKLVLKHIFDATKSETNDADQKHGQTENNQVLDSTNEVILSYNQRLTDLVTKLKEENKDQVRKLQREVESVQELNKDLHERLSKLAGSKLTDNNPNITNLGDPNRPMKIGDSFSELYDNEWTDAMDFCQKRLGPKLTEDKIIENLYKTLMSCYNICQEKSESEIKKVRERFEDISKELGIEIQEEIFKQIKDSRKLSAEDTSNSFLKDVRSLKDVIAKKHLILLDEKFRKLLLPLPFFATCFKLCWKMVVQTPQMILQAGPRAGEEFDKSVFREYTTSGSKVVFTVWPALYLHKGGPLLTKGVVKVK